ncbi:MAG: Fic family protein [Nitrospirales bacterium]
MSVVVHPPNFKNHLLLQGDKLFDLLQRINAPDFQSIITKANHQYLHWHKFRYIHPLPEGVTHEELWAFLKIGREANKKLVPFKDKDEVSFTYWIPDSLFKLLHEIDLWGGGTLTTDTSGFLPAKEPYIISSLMEEAIASSQLEGAATTRKVAKEMLRSGRKPRDVSERMILNNWETMQYIRENCHENFSLERILDLHKIITTDTLQNPEEAGRLRNRDDIIVEYNQETVHIPPNATTLPERIQQLCDFANRDQADNWIHPIFKGAIIHFVLAYDHPFTDGNGRTARALMYWYLLSRNYVLFEYLSISRYMRSAPAKYVQAFLFTETDSNDLTYFLFYNLKAIHRAIHNLKAYLQKKQKEVENSNIQLRSIRGLNPRQKMLVHHALAHPYAEYTIETHKNHHAIVYQTARQDLLDLEKKGYLKKEKIGREFSFFPSPTIGEKLKTGSRRTN